mmetsp:Transcript_1456/g.4952  ORF Transcript_1456/g.4952 Transcript_1456/m.4952 type:complete len:473 (-) Transcript_1456:189-1607(-)
MHDFTYTRMKSRAGSEADELERSDTERPYRVPSFTRSRSVGTIHEMELDPGKNARVAASKAISILMKMEQEGYCGVEKGSVYGAAVAVPQIARSAGWPKTLLGLTIRVYTFLIVNFLLQMFLVCVINEEALVMNSYSGQMHLCDFGAAIEHCPGSPKCRGPGGTEITGPRLYSYGVWNTRSFVRDSLKLIFPEKAEEIDQKVDPGEYGMENWYCRMVCCFLFMMAVVDDLRASIELGYLLFLIPSEESYWIRYETPEWADKEHAKAVHGWGELDLVKFQIRGMPRKWKILNLMCVLIPKIFLWFVVTSAGFRFLMETAGIVDLVVNAMALTFVLSIDEMIIDRFGTVATKHMMEHLEAWPLFDTDEEDNESMEEAYERHQHEDSKSFCSDIKLLLLLLPKRLLFVILLLVTFTLKYYVANCTYSEDGYWISKDMYLPKRVRWDALSLFMGHGDDLEAEPFWTMPGPKNVGSR